MQNRLVSTIKHIFHILIINKQQEVNFWILYSFLWTFIVSRLIVYNFPDLFINARGTHIHHYAYGILILAVVGFASLHDLNQRAKRISAILYGIGLGLALDEFGMWIMLNDNYWVRRSYDAIFIVSTFLFSTVYFGYFWKKIIFKIYNLFTGIEDEIENIEDEVTKDKINELPK
jgi:hypothetical protein